MTVVKFTAALVSVSASYGVSTVGSLAVGQIAQFIARQENRFTAGTLEMARPLEPYQSLDNIDFQAGDRLVIFTQPARPAEFFPPLRPGDKTLRFFLRETEVATGGKKALLIGKSDENQGVFPDIDLRAVALEHALDYLSRQTAQLRFDDASQIWYAVKVGQTRIMLDDVEIGTEPVALGVEHRMRFYRANESPSLSRPIAEIAFRAEAVRGAADAPALLKGDFPLHVRVGVEREVQTLRGSTSLPLGKVGTSLIQYVNAAPISTMQLTLMRVLPPQTRIAALKPDDYLYAALTLRR